MSRHPIFVFCPLVPVMLAICAIACGDEEEEIDATIQCEQQDLAAFSLGDVSNGDQLQLEVHTPSATPGQIIAGEVRLQIGHAHLPGADPEEDDPYPVILRLADPGGPEEFGRYLDDLSQDGPLQLDIFDATDIGAGSEDLTSLDDFDCSIAQGTICLQVGLDTAGDGILFDDDEYVFNAASGTVTVDGFVTSSRTFSVHWDVQLGRNIMTFGDESSGPFSGCFRSTYTPQQDYWLLE